MPDPVFTWKTVKLYMMKQQNKFKENVYIKFTYVCTFWRGTQKHPSLISGLKNALSMHFALSQLKLTSICKILLQSLIYSSQVYNKF